MHSSKHLAANVILGAALLYFMEYTIWSTELLVIVLFGFFIDLDHLFNEMVKGNLFYPDKMVVQWTAVCDEYTGELYLFHSYEFMILILLLGFLWQIFFFAFVGLALHFVFDAITNFNGTHSLAFLEDYSVIRYIYIWRHYPVFKKFFTEFYKVIKPRFFLNLLILYLTYAYQHPDTTTGWLFAKMHPKKVIKNLVAKLE